MNQLAGDEDEALRFVTDLLLVKINPFLRQRLFLARFQLVQGKIDGTKTGKGTL